MNEAIRQLEPKVLWNYFADLNNVPRPSKKEEKVIAFMKEFGESLGLETIVDHIGNVIIKKPATPGMENRTPVILQGHIDMVCQKNNDTDFDFDTQAINMYVDNGWVKARGTTLGADNGIGVVAAMAVLASNDIAHPPIEGLFTIDEETGMTGAIELKAGMLNGKILLNLDSEDERELTIGCAGGIDVTANKKMAQMSPPTDHIAYKITVSGLTGGHSGMEIHLGRGNANKLMNRILWTMNKEIDMFISSLDGGSLRNAIPRESVATITVNKKDIDKFEALIKGLAKDIVAEHKTTDSELEVDFKIIDMAAKVINKSAASSMLNSLYACPNGIYRMSPDIDGLVQTSNNLARVLLKDGELLVQCLTRSSVDTEKIDLANVIIANFEMADAKVDLAGSYPGWQPDTEAKINDIMKDLYNKEFGKEPEIAACHAGLECGIIKEKYTKTDMISFGPDIRGAHSPDERVDIASVGRFWNFLKNVLANIPEG